MLKELNFPNFNHGMQKVKQKKTESRAVTRKIADQSYKEVMKQTSHNFMNRLTWKRTLFCVDFACEPSNHRPNSSLIYIFLCTN